MGPGSWIRRCSELLHQNRLKCYTKRAFSFGWCRVGVKLVGSGRGSDTKTPAKEGTVAMTTDGRLTICQISDIHCGSAYFVPDLLERSILEINDYDPTAVVVSGGPTGAGHPPGDAEGAPQGRG